MAVRVTVTVCQLAFEAYFRKGYHDPSIAAKRQIWDAAWSEAVRAAALIRQEFSRLDNHNEFTG